MNRALTPRKSEPVSEHADLHPESGARLLFELETSDPQAATYALSALMPEGVTHRGSGKVSAGTEQVAVEGLEEAPDWVRTLAQRFLRQIAAGQRGVATPRWPRRVLRWRDR